VKTEREAPTTTWYHTMDLPNGPTHALFDLRNVPAKLPLPASMAGMRVLDAASADGFFAFEFARRGADEVVSLDLDDPSEKDWQGVPDAETARQGFGNARQRFEYAQEILGFNQVKRVDRNLYDISPEALGTFDFVFLGNVMLHLADPRPRRRVASSGVPCQSFSDGSSRSRLTTSSAPRRANSKAKNPSADAASSTRIPANDAGNGSRPGTFRRSNSALVVPMGRSMA
jgi:tRNA (mo5U34)-methyltransferase